ncbi:MAG TPA: multiheme c-type cytochrome, partial [Bryobacteraceae bacterium]
MAVAFLAFGTLTTVQAQTDLQAKLTARPLTRGDIAAFKLPSTLQLSGGLKTVGVGEPIYLEAQVNSAYPAGDISGVTWELTLKPVLAKASLTDSPLGKDVKIYEPADRLVAQVAGRSLLVPDMAGEWVVTAGIATKTGTTKVAQTFIAATYVGIATCVRCHSGGMAQNMALSWSKTAHANLFKDGVNGVASDHYAASCIACHTVGYDTAPGAVNGGFDDVAAQLKWTFPTVQKAGVFEAMPDALKNVANIQCESCHGPGSVHASTGGSSLAISKSMGSADCAQCHDAPTHHIKNGEWNNSRHAVVTRDPSGAGRESCVGCHTGPGFI